MDAVGQIFESKIIPSKTTRDVIGIPLPFRNLPLELRDMIWESVVFNFDCSIQESGTITKARRRVHSQGPPILEAFIRFPRAQDEVWKWWAKELRTFVIQDYIAFEWSELSELELGPGIQSLQRVNFVLPTSWYVNENCKRHYLPSELAFKSILAELKSVEMIELDILAGGWKHRILKDEVSEAVFTSLEECSTLMDFSWKLISGDLDSIQRGRFKACRKLAAKRKKEKAAGSSLFKRSFTLPL